MQSRVLGVLCLCPSESVCASTMYTTVVCLFLWFPTKGRLSVGGGVISIVSGLAEVLGIYLQENPVYFRL